MQVEITIKNYRCFSDEKPAKISFQEGFTGFIGPNNAGKSSLLKFFYEFRDIFALLQKPNILLNVIQGGRQEFNLASSVTDEEEVFCNINDRDFQIDIRFVDLGQETSQSGDVRPPKRLIATIPRNKHSLNAKLYLDDNPFAFEPKNIGLDGWKLLLFSKPKADLTCIVELCQKLQATLYIGPFRNAINVGTLERYFDIEVGQSFISRWRHYKTGDTKEYNRIAYSLTQDIKKIFGFSELEINPTPDDKTLQINLNGQTYRLLELGSGLAQFIVVFVNAAINQPSYILIDEPELNLHPSLQLDFMTSLTSYAKEGILFATHSIGLARAAADRIYSLQQIEEGKSEVTDFETTPRLSEFLGELSFSGYRELGFEKVLLVEGSTEVKTIQQFLRWYRKDHQVVLLPLGGANLIKESSEAELQEIKRITNDVFALIDSERSEKDEELEPGRAKFVKTCEDVGIPCHVLERRAIENYLSERAVKLVKGDKYCALAPYQKLKALPLGWGKQENWRIAREMTPDELETTDLGKFLKSL